MARRNKTLLFSVSLFCRTANSSDVKDKPKSQFPKSRAVTKLNTEFCDALYVDLTAVCMERAINFGHAAALGLK